MIVIVDYGIGNISSISNILKKIGAKSIVSSNIDEIKNADKLILPGMGAFDNCMQKFEQSGLQAAIEKKVLEDKVPILGICVGLQMFMNSSEEGLLPGLGWVNGTVVRLKPEAMSEAHKIPNMGWLEISSKKMSRLLQDLEEARFYFAHSYHVKTASPADELMSSYYGYEFTVGIEKENILGIQFHPEKSHRFGMQLLKNFSENY